MTFAGKIPWQTINLAMIRIVAMVLLFLQAAALNWAFGIQIYGVFSFSFAICLALVILLNFGQDELLLREVARRGVDAVGLSGAFQSSARVLRLWIAPGALILLAGLAWVLLSHFKTWTYTAALPFMLLAVPLLMMQKLVEGLAQGAHHIARSIIGSQIALPTLLSLFAFGVMALGVTPSIGLLVGLFCVAVALSLMVTVTLNFGTVRALLAQTGSAAKQPSQDSVIRSGYNFLLIALGLFLSLDLLVLLSGFFLTAEDVALVRIAGRIAIAASFIRLVLLLQYRPKLAQTYASGDLTQLQTYATQLALAFTATGLVIISGAWVFSEQLLRLFGEEYVVGEPLLRLFLAGVFVTLIFGPANAVLSMTEYEVLASRNTLLMVAAQLVTGFICIHVFGVVGAGIAYLVSMTLYSGLGAFAIQRHIGINVTVLSVFGTRT